MGNFFGCCTPAGSGSGSSAARLGARLAYASPAGATAAAPAGFSSSTGRLLVTLPSGDASWSSLTAGTDGQLCVIVNADATHTLTLPQANWGGPADLPLLPGNEALAYYDATLVSWRLTSP